MNEFLFVDYLTKYFPTDFINSLTPQRVRDLYKIYENHYVEYCEKRELKYEDF